MTLGGDDVAEVRDVVYDPSQGRLVGFTLNSRGWLGRRLKDSLSWGSVAALGPDAVMIRDEGDLAAEDEATPSLAEPPSDRNVLGDAVLTDEGVQLGVVSDIIVETGERAEVVGYEIEDKSADAKASRVRFLPLPQQLAVVGRCAARSGEGRAVLTRRPVRLRRRGRRLPQAARRGSNVTALRSLIGRRVVSGGTAEALGDVDGALRRPDVAPGHPSLRSPRAQRHVRRLGRDRCRRPRCGDARCGRRSARAGERS